MACTQKKRYSNDELRRILDKGNSALEVEQFRKDYREHLHDTKVDKLKPILYIWEIANKILKPNKKGDRPSSLELESAVDKIKEKLEESYVDGQVRDNFEKLLEEKKFSDIRDEAVRILEKNLDRFIEEIKKIYIA